MARPSQRKAAKDYPANGIAKGETYWYVQIKTGPRSSRVMRQKEPFKPQQLTSSEYQSALYDWEETLAGVEDRESAQAAADTIRELGEEQQGKLDNMPEGLQQGSTGEMLTERAEACAAAADEIENIISEWESAENEWDSEIEDYHTERKYFDEETAAYAEWEEADNEDLDEPEVRDEPDLPDHTAGEGEDVHFDPTEFIDQVREVSVG